MAAATRDHFAFGKGAAADGAVDRDLGKNRALAGLAVAGLTLGAIGTYQVIMAGDKARIADRMHAVRSAEGNRQAPAVWQAVHSVILPAWPCIWMAAILSLAIYVPLSGSTGHSAWVLP